MKMKMISAMIQDGTFLEYKKAVASAEMHGDAKFRYRNRIINTRSAKLEVTFAETFMDSLKNMNDDNINRNNQLE